MVLAAAMLLVLSSGWLPQRKPARSVATPGVTKSAILIGDSLPESGPAASYGLTGGGAKAYFAYVNAHGGIYGRKLTLIALDDGYDPARTLANVKRLVLLNHVFALLGVVGTANNLTVLPFLTQQGVPSVAALSGSSLLRQPFHKYLFPLIVTYTVEGRFLTDYAVHALHAKRIALLYQDDAFGQEGLTAAKVRAPKDGAALVAAAPYKVTDSDLSPQVLRLQHSGADAVIFFAIPSIVARFVSTAAKVGFHPALLSSSVADDATMLALLGPAGEGIYFDLWTPPPTAATAQGALFRSIVAKYGNPVTAPPNLITESGMAGAQVLVQALRRAGPSPTRAGLITALEALRHWNGGLAFDVTYTPTEHSGALGIRMVRSHHGTFVPVAGPASR
ncbi:MAG TPA: ABC transporter substrate-binding protein [Chloroflexota bacterium]|nr:ABC transporter substrate-binding protein [Chloroflexota bacterium]